VPSVLNPPNGWLQNTNNWPWSRPARTARKQADFPRYMETFGENHAGVHAIRVLVGTQGLHARWAFATPPLTAASGIRRLVPGLITAWEREPSGSALKAQLAGQIAALRGWDYRWGR
jgi:acyl-homoserine-lactone acylase